MSYTLTIDLGPTTHLFRLPPWVNTRLEAQLFHQALTQGLYSVEKVFIIEYGQRYYSYLASVTYEDVQHGLAIPAENHAQACQVLKAAAVAELTLVS